MSKRRGKKRSPKRVLALPDLEQTKSAVLNSLISKSGQRSYDHAINEFVDWYCSEPRLAFNRRWFSGIGSSSNRSNWPRLRSISGLRPCDMSPMKQPLLAC